MSRRFNGTTSQYLEHTGTLLMSQPISMACWFNIDILPSVSGGESELISLVRGTGPSWFYMGVENTNPNEDKIVANIKGTTSDPFQTTTTITTGTWHHAGAVSHSSTDHRVFLDGGGKGTNTNTQALVDQPMTRQVGILRTSALFNPCDGMIAEVGVWTIGLSDEDFARLAAGVPPSKVRPDGLIHYWKLWGNASPEPDLVERFDLTVTGATKGEDRPRIFYPRRRMISFPTSVSVFNLFPERYEHINVLDRSRIEKIHAF